MTEILHEPSVFRRPDMRGIIPDRDIPRRDTYSDKDRPGWIPPHILRGWDPDPYAYQTEEEMMPAGGPHGNMLAYLTEILRDFLKKKGMGFLIDTFMLYFDRKGTEQRIGPDLLIMPFRSPAPSSYDAKEEPPPYAVAEITSPKSRKKDLEDNVPLYTEVIGIPAYLVIDMFTVRGKLRKKPGLHLWRRTEDGVVKIKPDSGGWLRVPEMGIKIKARRGNVLLADMETDEILCDNGELKLKAEQEKQRAEQEKQRAERLAAKLRELGISPE
jgi:Uma2 family endonuclease